MASKADVFREVLACFERGDVEGVRPLLTSDVVGTSAQGWPEQGPFGGRDAVVGQFTRLAADWEENSVSDLEVVAENPDWVVLKYRWEVRGASSGLSTHFDLATACQFAGERIKRLHFAWTPEEALEVAGLN
jgi:ketosteroid isomerase-like protein